MHYLRQSVFVVVVACVLAGCSDSGDDNPSNSATTGAPIAGMAEGYVDFPVGAPLGGYTARCRCFGSQGKSDGRRTQYHNIFNPSVGVQTQPKAVALWLENGVDQIVFMKTDAIYTYEKVVNRIAENLSAATGKDMTGKVTLGSNHSHNAPANFDEGKTWYLGGDKFNREVFERMVASLSDVAIAAWRARQPAAIGIGQAVNWDPQNRVYSDRRGENNDKQFFSDIPAGEYKDPYLTVIRVDTTAGAPIGMFFAFGMHGTVAGEDNELWSVDSSGHVEAAVEERFDKPVVVGFLQHGGGDASPRGAENNGLFPRMESIGVLAVDAIYDLWQHTPTSSAPIRMETVTRSIDTRRDVLRVHRDYATLQYSPYNPDPSFMPDEKIYDEQGRIRNPIDEFNAEFGGAFCGAESAPLPVLNVGSNVFPYASCASVGDLSAFIGAIFMVDVEKPLPESLRAKTTASRIGPLQIREPSGAQVSDDVLFAFFPGEPTANYTEQFRRRALTELNMRHTVPIGYAQDHQGYLLIPEDWLLGGYEPSINIWGPLQAEHIMEGVLEESKEVLLDDKLDLHDPQQGMFPDPVYEDMPLPTAAPDLTPMAGTALLQLPSHFFMPLRGLQLEIAPPARLRRVQDIAQFMWEGGDPGVDLPVVTIERQNDAGEWVTLRTAAGRQITSAMHDIILSTTPDPLGPFDAPQHHTWWAAWQAVPHFLDRAGLPTGQYRFHVHGHSYAGGATTWPWPTTTYEVTSSSFEVEPADITLSLNGSVLTASIGAHPLGFRLIDIDGTSPGTNPVHGAVITALFENGETQQLTPTGEQQAGGHTTWSLDANSLTGATAIQVVDQYGNSGTLELAE